MELPETRKRISTGNQTGRNHEEENESLNRTIDEESEEQNIPSTSDLSIFTANNDQFRVDVNNEKHNFSFGITNARSLWSKMFSLYDFFVELELHCCIICETWFYDSPALEKLKCDALEGHSIGMIDYVRKREGNKNRGGGVSIAYHRGRFQLKKYNVKTNGHEIVVASGKIHNNTRPFYIIGVYVSTRLTKRQVEICLDTVNQAILKIKTEIKNPYIIVGGGHE